MPPKYQVTKLANGARIATAEMPHMESVSLGIWAEVGSRDESTRLNGIAHFAEHMLFKGTARRTARKISLDIEGVGGSINAFTSEDHTCYYAKATADRLPRLADVLMDMYAASAFPAKEVRREREVIVEEIAMYRENPGQHVEDLLSQAMWPNHALGRPITGTEQSLAAIARDDLRAFAAGAYCGKNTVAAAAGGITHAQAVDTLAPLLADLPAGSRPRRRRFDPQNLTGPRLCADLRDSEQVHFAVGFLTPGRQDPARYALKLLNVILGENMSSRLWQSLRERRGLCYHASSEAMAIADTGMLHAYAGMDPENARKAAALIAAELTRAMDRLPGKRELADAKTYTLGQGRLALERTTSQMMWVGESLIGYGKIVDPDESRANLAAVTAADVQAAARATFKSNGCGAAVVGPVESAEPLLEPFQSL